MSMKIPLTPAGISDLKITKLPLEVIHVMLLGKGETF
jgi:hypothetical protein